MADIPLFANGADFNGAKLLNILTGVADTDGVNKKQLDDAIAAAVAGLLDYKGTYNPVTNAPDLTTLPNGVLVGDSYVISADGSFNGEAVEVGDMIIANTDEATGVSQWDILQVNIDPSIFGGSTIHVVEDQAGAAALTGLKVGDGIYVKNVTPDLQPSFQVVTVITDGDYLTSTVRWVTYNASGSAVKNEGTADLTTTFPGNNTNVPLRVRTGLPGIGLLQKVNMDGVIQNDNYSIQIKDPRGTGLSVGDPVTIYDFECSISFRRFSGGNSTFEFRFFTKRGVAPISYVIDSSRIRVTDTGVQSINFSRKLAVIHDDIIGIGVERTSGNGTISVERYTLTAMYAAQQGFR